MEKVCAKLQNMGEPIASYRALEFFAREGDWQTQKYAPLVAELHLWEIDPKCKLALRRNYPEAKIRIGNSFVIAHESQYNQYFNWIVFDNPQMTYGAYCEHFEALGLVRILMASGGVIIFNVNKKPFNYEKNSEWSSRRSIFYKRDAANLPSAFLLNFYAAYVEKEGFTVRYIFEEKRNTEYLSYIVMGICRSNEERHKS